MISERHLIDGRVLNFCRLEFPAVLYVFCSLQNLKCWFLFKQSYLFHHFVHGLCGWLPDDDVEGFCRHDEALFDEQMSLWPMYSLLWWWVQLTTLKSSATTTENSLTH
jgi:hypothetical protein